MGMDAFDKNQPKIYSPSGKYINLFAWPIKLEIQHQRSWSGYRIYGMSEWKFEVLQHTKSLLISWEEFHRATHPVPLLLPLDGRMDRRTNVWYDSSEAHTQTEANTTDAYM